MNFINYMSGQFASKKSTGKWLLESAILWGSVSSLVVLFLVKIGIISPLVFAAKDGIVYLLAIVFARAWLRTSSSYIGLFILAVLSLLLFINYQILNPEYPAPLYNIRQLIAPLILLLVFCSVRLNYKETEALTKFLCNIIIALVAFGAFEQAFEVWKKINLSLYFEIKNIPTDAYGMSYMFYEPAFGNRERMTTAFIDPISAGHFFASAAIFLMYSDHKSAKQKIALILSLGGLFFTLSKGALLQFFIGSFLLNSRINVLIRMASIMIPYVFYILLPDQAGVQIHLNGLIHAFDSVSLFGHGIGSAGNYSTMFSDNGITSGELGIGDTFVGALIGQIGAVGALLWLLIALSFISFGKTFWGARSAYIIFLSIFLVSVFSENTMNVTSFLVPAAIISIARKQSHFATRRVAGKLEIEREMAV